jgi:hypothetical protein
MTELLRRASERGWPVFQWCYRCTVQTPANPLGWLDPAEVERKRLEVPAAMWAAQYDLQEPRPDSRAFEPEAVAAMFREELASSEVGRVSTSRSGRRWRAGDPRPTPTGPRSGTGQ